MPGKRFSIVESTSFGPSAAGTKPFVRTAIQVLPSAIPGRAVIFFTVSAIYNDGEAIIKNSLSEAASTISFETVMFSDSL